MRPFQLLLGCLLCGHPGRCFGGVASPGELPPAAPPTVDFHKEGLSHGELV